MKLVNLKRTCIGLAAIALIFSLSACEKKSETGTGTDVKLQAISNAPAMYIIRHGAGLYDISGADATYKSALTLGEAVTSLKDTTKAKIDSKEYTFVKIRKDDGKEGWVIDFYAAQNGLLAVVTSDKALIYKGARNVDVTGEILPRGTVFVVFPATVKDNFSGFTAYEMAKKYVITDKFLKQADFSSSASDIQSAILMQVASLTKEKIQIEALLTTASKDYPDSVFASEIQTKLNAFLEASNKPSSAIDNLKYVVTVETLNVRKVPNEVDGEVVGTVKMGDELIAVAQTISEYTIEGESSVWYEISSPVKGWVFGAGVAENKASE